MLLRLSLLVLCLGGVIAKPQRSVGMKNLLLPSGEKDKPNMLFTKEPRPSTMTTLGSSVTLSCAGTSSLPTGEPSVSWLFTPKITPDIKLWEGLVGGTSGTLILGNLQKSDGGYYFCQITDGYGYSLISRGALVNVTYLDPDFGAYPEEKTITESKAYIKVPCQPPASNPPAKINWYKDGKLIEKVENMIQEYVSPNKYGSLIIFNPRTSDSGMYACEASNINANPEKRKTSEVLIDIKVEGSGTYAQKFVQDHDVLVNKGEDAVLHAGAIGFPVPSYRWTLGVSVEIDVNPGSRFSTADFGRDLRISGVRTEDRGTYYCQYKNVYTDSVAVVRLYVKEDLSFNTVLTEQTVEHLTPLTFDCQCSGTPYSGDPTAPPSVLWLRDGQPIVDGKRFKEEDGSLVMSGLEMAEAGMYQCFCYNTMQISQTYMPVSVKSELPVKRDVEIEWDLESTPLEIRTDSELGSDDQVQVRFYSAVGAYAGGIMLLFSSTPQYSLGYCTSSYKNFAVNPPSAADKVWRITLTRTAGVRLVIHCNEVEVLNILLSQTCAYDIWSSKWSDDVAKIKFHLSDDTASDYYGTQLQLPEEDTSEEDDESEQGDNQNYSDAAALKVSLIFLVVLLFAVDMSI